MGGGEEEKGAFIRFPDFSQDGNVAGSVSVLFGTSDLHKIHKEQKRRERSNRVSEVQEKC